jgi:hypothetical protein
MNYLFNDRNLVRAGVLSALNVNPSTAIYRTDTAAKQGGGAVTVTGPYTGAHDTTLDVEILDATGDSSQVSEPVFSGVGNGTMTDAAVTALDPQDIVVTLVDLGTPTLAAQAPFQGVTLVAKDTGPSGNSILVSVDASGIVRGDPFASLQHSISAGTNQFTGSEWNFGALPLINGKLDPATPRICFGEDPQVYRPFKVYDTTQGQYVYSFSPAPVRDVPAFASVRLVTGTWTLHITDGISPEDFTGVVTLYDALSSIQAGSDLVSVQGVVVNDLTPNGQGANDLSVFTDSYVLSVTGTGSQFVTRNDLVVSVAASAPTETLRVICTDASHVGAEVWSVNGDISGDLGSAISGEAFAAGSYGFTIPLQIPSTTPPGGNITAVFQPQPRAEGAQTPDMCLDGAQLGARATSGQFTFVWKKRPAPDCDCATGSLEGGPNADCLGVQPQGGGVVSASNKRLVRLQLLTAAVTAIVRANTSPIANADMGDVDYMQIGGAKLLKGLDDIAVALATPPFPDWTASHAYVVDDIVAPGDGYRYRASTAGTSGSSRPTFVHTTPYTSTTTDGSVTWTVMEKDAWGIWDDALAGFKTDVDVLSEIALGNAKEWGISAAYSLGDIVFSIGTTTGDDVERVRFFYKCTAAGTSAAVATTLSTIQMESGVATVTGDGTCEWQCIVVMRSGQLIRPVVIEATAYQGYSIDDYLEARYGSLMDNARAAAGIDPNFKGAGVNGDGCWQDFGDLYWFESQDGLLPMFAGHWYNASKMILDANGKPFAQSTEQFAVGIRWGCQDALAIGDTVVVTLENVTGGPTTYQSSDEWDIAVAHGEPLQLGGGQDGDDTLTWSVVSSIGTAFDPYALVTTALAPYANGGLTFQITPGGIPFALGDNFRLSIEGGHFRWRRDGGSWSSSTIIGDTSASDGLTIVFAGGAAPSWVASDAWSFTAEATNGPDRAKSPTDGRFAWTGSTTLTIVPDAPGPATTLGIFDHHIPSDAVIHLQGSDDNFSTTPTDITIAWAERNILKTFTSVTRAKWRITVDKGGDMFWPFLGLPMQPMLRDPGTGDLKPDAGHFVRRRRVPGVGVRSGIGGDCTHDVVCAESLDDFEAGLDYACASDDGGFGLVTNTAAGECALVRFAGLDVETKEQVFDYQASILDRYQTFTLTVEPLP